MFKLQFFLGAALHECTLRSQVDTFRMNSQIMMSLYHEFQTAIIGGIHGL